MLECLGNRPPFWNYHVGPMQVDDVTSFLIFGSKTQVTERRHVSQEWKHYRLIILCILIPSISYLTSIILAIILAF